MSATQYSHRSFAFLSACAVILICSSLVPPVNGARILGIFTMPCKSQYLLGSALFKQLALKGHQVTIISNTCSNAPSKNYREICPKSIYQLKEELNFPILDRSTPWNYLKSLKRLISELPRGVINDSEVKKLIENGEKFDVTIHTTFFNEALFGLSHQLNSTVIGFSPLGTNFFINYLTANSAPYSYVPFLLVPFSDEMSFWQRTANTLASIFTELLLRFWYYPLQAEILKESYPQAPPLEHLIENVDLYFLNSHYTTETPRPLLQNLIQIGGFYMQNTEQLPTDIQNFLDSSNGFVYFSFGTNFNSSKSLSDHQKQAIISGLSQLPYKVLWKYEADLKNLPKNIKIAKWVPQKSILAHKNIKAFVSHSGMGGTAEALFYGVPMVCIPILGDQMSHARKSVAEGFGLSLDFHKFNGDDLKNAIVEVATDRKYKESVMLKSDIYRNQPINPIDHVDYWIRHVIKHKGAKHLKARAAKIPWYQYYLLDVGVVLLGLVLCSVIGGWIIFRWFCRRILRFFCKRKDKVE